MDGAWPSSSCGVDALAPPPPAGGARSDRTPTAGRWGWPRGQRCRRDRGAGGQRPPPRRDHPPGPWPCPV